MKLRAPLLGIVSVASAMGELAEVAPVLRRQSYADHLPAFLRYTDHTSE